MRDQAKNADKPGFAIGFVGGILTKANYGVDEHEALSRATRKIASKEKIISLSSADPVPAIDITSSIDLISDKTKLFSLFARLIEGDQDQMDLLYGFYTELIRTVNEPAERVLLVKIFTETMEKREINGYMYRILSSLFGADKARSELSDFLTDTLRDSDTKRKILRLFSIYLNTFADVEDKLRVYKLFSDLIKDQDVAIELEHQFSNMFEDLRYKRRLTDILAETHISNTDKERLSNILSDKAPGEEEKIRVKDTLNGLLADIKTKDRLKEVIPGVTNLKVASITGWIDEFKEELRKDLRSVKRKDLSDPCQMDSDKLYEPEIEEIVNRAAMKLIAHPSVYSGRDTVYIDSLYFRMLSESEEFSQEQQKNVAMKDDLFSDLLYHEGLHLKKNEKKEPLYTEEEVHEKAPVERIRKAMKKRTILIAQSGGDCAGLNTVVGNTALELAKKGYAVFGIKQGFTGLAQPDIENYLIHIDRRKAERFLSRPTTDLGSSREEPFSIIELIKTHENKMFRNNAYSLLRRMREIRDWSNITTEEAALFSGMLKLFDDEGFFPNKEEAKKYKKAFEIFVNTLKNALGFYGLVVTGGDDHCKLPMKIDWFLTGKFKSLLGEDFFSDVTEPVEENGSNNASVPGAAKFVAVGIPKSIDYDAATQMLGFETARQHLFGRFWNSALTGNRRNSVTGEIEDSELRVSIFEVMGRKAGWLTLGVASRNKMDYPELFRVVGPREYYELVEMAGSEQGDEFLDEFKEREEKQRLFTLSNIFKCKIVNGIEKQNRIRKVEGILRKMREADELKNKMEQIRDTVMIILPEKPVSIINILRRAKEIRSKKGVINIAVSEGFKINQNDPLWNLLLEKQPLLKAKIKAAGKLKPDKHGNIQLAGASEFVWGILATRWSELEGAELAEVARVSPELAEELKTMDLGLKWRDINHTIFGYIGRGLRPSVWDMRMAEQYVEKAVELLMEKKTGYMVAYSDANTPFGSEPVALPAEKVLTLKGKKFSRDLITLSEGSPFFNDVFSLARESAEEALRGLFAGLKNFNKTNLEFRENIETAEQVSFLYFGRFVAQMSENKGYREDVEKNICASLQFLKKEGALFDKTAESVKAILREYENVVVYFKGFIPYTDGELCEDGVIMEGDDGRVKSYEIKTGKIDAVDTDLDLDTIIDLLLEDFRSTAVSAWAHKTGSIFEMPGGRGLITLGVGEPENWENWDDEDKATWEKIKDTIIVLVPGREVRLTQIVEAASEKMKQYGTVNIVIGRGYGLSEGDPVLKKLLQKDEYLKIKFETSRRDYWLIELFRDDMEERADDLGRSNEPTLIEKYNILRDDPALRGEFDAKKDAMFLEKMFKKNPEELKKSEGFADKTSYLKDFFSRNPVALVEMDALREDFFFEKFFERYPELVGQYARLREEHFRKDQLYKVKDIAKFLQEALVMKAPGVFKSLSAARCNQTGQTLSIERMADVKELYEERTSSIIEKERSKNMEEIELLTGKMLEQVETAGERTDNIVIIMKENLPEIITSQKGEQFAELLVKEYEMMEQHLRRGFYRNEKEKIEGVIKVKTDSDIIEMVNHVSGLDKNIKIIILDDSTMGTVMKQPFREFLKYDEQKIERLWKNIGPLGKNYINADGTLREEFSALKKSSEMDLDEEFSADESRIFAAIKRYEMIKTQRQMYLTDRKAGEDYCVISAQSDSIDDSRSIPFVNLNAMAYLGVGILQENLSLFRQAYRLFTGEKPDENLLKQFAKKALSVIKVLPRIIKLTGKAVDERDIRDIFKAAA
ncbi:MAG: 6-phosphofructokinase [Candidatus Omnitrophota bacterium]